MNILIGDIGNTITKVCLIEVKNLKKSFLNKDLVVIANNRLEYSKMNLSRQMSLLNKNGIIYDFWNFFKFNKFLNKNKSHYVSFGHHISINNEQ